MNGLGVASLQEPLDLLGRLLALLADPTVAYLLLVLGLLAIVAEVVTPGAVFPGVTGALCLLLSLYGLLNLPTNWIGVGLITAGVVMFLIDIKITGWALSVGGAVALALGSLLLFTPFWVADAGTPAVRLNPWVAAATTGGVVVFFLLVLGSAVRAQFAPRAMGKETMTGKSGVVEQRLSPIGIVRIEGEQWSAVSADGADIPAGADIVVVGTEGLVLHVKASDHER